MAYSADSEAQALRVNGLRDLVRRESSEGRSLAANPHDNCVCTIGIDTGADCVELVWKNYATSNQLRFVHEFMLLQVLSQDLSAILGDDTLVPTVHAEDRKWIVEDWMPRARKCGLARIAATVSHRHFGRVAIDEVHLAAPPGIEIRTFPEFAAAREWLRTAGA